MTLLFERIFITITMAPEKRKLPGKIAKMQARKKAKLEEPSAPPGDAPKKSRAIRGDELAWREVELPEGMDDLEGFYGLEEIDGVDIIKDQNGTLSFAAAHGIEPESRTRKGRKNVRDDKPDPFPAVIDAADVSQAVDAETGDQDEVGDEWTGFSDEEEQTTDPSQEAQDDEVEDDDAWEDEEDEDSEAAVAEEDDSDEPGENDAETAKLRKLLRQMTQDQDLSEEDGEWPEEDESDGPDVEVFDENGELVEEADEDTDQSSAEPAAPKTSGKQQPSKSAKADVNELLGNGGSFSALQEESEGEEDVDVSAWRALGLLPATLSGLSKLGFPRPTDIQRAAIPRISKGQDVIGKAPTGSGKTLAYGIPIFESWLGSQSTDISKDTGLEKPHTALIIAPTRELAKQIEDHMTALVATAVDHPPRIATLTGGLSVHKQKRLLATADVVIATPGRLWEIITEVKGSLAPLQQIKFLVLDEADRLLSAGHFQEVTQILSALDRKGPGDDAGVSSDQEDQTSRQTLVFSATFAQSLSQSLTGSTRKSSLSSTDEMTYLLRKLNFRSTQPAFVDVQPTSAMAPTLREALVQLPAGLQKDLYLYAILLYRPTARILVFVNSIAAARRLVPFLANLGIDAQPLHSQMPQKARLRAIEKFTAASSTASKKPGPTGITWKGNVLVATDVAARGLDIPDIDVVLHYHVPRAADTYVHRSGRTARAENAGSSVLICAPEEAAGVRRLVAQVHAKHESQGKRRKGNVLEALSLDRQLISRLRPRATLAKHIADAEMAKEKARGEDRVLAEAADDLGVEYDSEGDLDGSKKLSGKSGRGKKRKEQEKEAAAMTKAEMKSKRAELRELLAERVNTGVSARYLTSGSVDIEQLLKERASGGHSAFLGELPSLGFEL